MARWKGLTNWLIMNWGRIAIRDELMEGDLRALYIAWLAAQEMIGVYDEDEEDVDSEISVPPVPPASVN